MLILQTRKMKDARSGLCEDSRLVAQRSRVLFYSRAGSLEGWLVPGNRWVGGSVWWVERGWQLSPMQPLTRFLPQQEGAGRAKSRKLGNWDKDGSIGEAKLHAQAKQQEEFILYALSAGRCPAAAWAAGLLHLQQLLGKANTVTPKVSPLHLPFPKLLLLGMMLRGMKIPLLGLGQLSWPCPLPAACPHPVYSLRGQSGKKKKPWRCANTVQRQWCVISTSSQIQHAVRYGLLWRKLTPLSARPSAQHCLCSGDRCRDHSFSDGWVRRTGLETKSGGISGKDCCGSEPSYLVLAFWTLEC